MTSGSRAGTSYLLDPTDDNRIGRGLECAIVLTDPLCSRVHVVINYSDNAWKVRDAESRNGTFVNGQKIDDAVLAPGHRIRLGSTEFCFEQSETPPQFHHAGITVTQTLIKNQAIDQVDAVAFHGLAAIPDSQQAQELLLLYQLSIKLLGCDEPDEVVRVALELLADWTHATLVGFLWISDDGQLKPKILLPATASEAVALSKSLTDLVCQKKNAVWIANQSTANPLE
ncbi:MAG TPA: FHA domain-containing protein, partial [Pirellulales bacterium]